MTHRSTTRVRGNARFGVLVLIGMLLVVAVVLFVRGPIGGAEDPPAWRDAAARGADASSAALDAGVAGFALDFARGAERRATDDPTLAEETQGDASMRAPETISDTEARFAREPIDHAGTAEVGAYMRGLLEDFDVEPKSTVVACIADVCRARLSFDSSAQAQAILRVPFDLASMRFAIDDADPSEPSIAIYWRRAEEAPF